MTDRPDVEPKVRRVIVNLCEPCIGGEGQECHTPGCALFLHRVDLPIGEELLEDAPDPSSLTPAEVREAAARIVMDLAIEEGHRSEKAHLVAMPETESQHWRAYLMLKDAAEAIRAMPLTRPEGQP